MDLHVASLTDTGRARSNNEDSLLADPPLIAIADGMGGHEGGEVASAIAVEVLANWRDRLEGRAGREAAEKLRDAFADVNRAVFQKSQDDESVQGMGTTLTAAWVGDDKLSVAHVGDSRAYLLRGDTLEQLTEDQNVAQEWVRRGRLSQQEAATSPQRHVLLQAIGADTDDLDVEISTVELRSGDRIVLASDGLFGMLKDNERLREILLEHPDRDEACRALIDAANAAGGQDNISVVIVDVGDPSQPAAPVPVVVDREVTSAPPAAQVPAPATPSRRFPRTAFIAGGAVVLLALFAVFFLVRPTDATYVVTSRRGNVVVLEGRAGNDNVRPRGDVVRTFRDEKIDEFPTPTQRQLRAGIEVDSLREARRVIDQLPRTLGPDATPTPKPKGSPSPTPGKTPAPKPSPTP